MSRHSIFTIAVVAGMLGLCWTMFNTQRTRAADPAPGAIYAQLSSPDSQDPKDAPLLVSMTSNDALGGLEHNDKAKTTDVVVKTAGVYFMVAAIQVGKDQAGDAGDYLDIWMKQNGKDVDNSNCRQVIYDPKYTTVLVCQGIAECKAGDIFNVAISASASNHGIGIKAIKPKGEPVVPSIIFSMYKVN
jgi:hypothetical protein